MVLDNFSVRENSRVILINEQNELLLMRVQLTTYTFWCTIGGGIEPGESPESAAKREVFEEIGFFEQDIVWGGIIWYGEQFLKRSGVLTFIKESFILAKSQRREISKT